MGDTPSAAHMDTCVDRLITVVGTLHVSGRMLSEVEPRYDRSWGSIIEFPPSKGNYVCANCSA